MTPGTTISVGAGTTAAGGTVTNTLWSVQVCHGATQVALRKLTTALPAQEFDEEDFSP